MNTFKSKAALSFGLFLLATTSVVPPGTDAAHAATRLEADVAAAAGRAAGVAANRAVSHAVIRGAARYKGPACHAGANDLGLRGARRAIFIAECRKVL